MIDIDTFAIIGGDQRQIAMAESILDDGYKVNAVGFEKTELKKGIIKTDMDNAIKKSKYIILPLPAVTKNNCLNAPYAEFEIKVNDDFARKMYEKKVFCGMDSKLKLTSDIWNNIDLRDYSKKEEFAIKNAVPTAEGAIEIAMHEYGGTINGSRCLVVGYGRIGKILSSMLKGIGANVTVSARKSEDLVWIKIFGYNTILTRKISSNHNFDIIFNTVPALIFDELVLKNVAQNSIIIDLASMPGGVDFEAAERLKIKTIQALGLPGKVAPKTAGEIIKNTIYNMIEEE